MKAAIYQGEGRMAVEDIPIPDPQTRIPKLLFLFIFFANKCAKSG